MTYNIFGSLDASVLLVKAVGGGWVASQSGRRWRIELPRCWPPSAAQTARAVFPHAAFTKAHPSEMQSRY